MFKISVTIMVVNVIIIIVTIISNAITVFSFWVDLLVLFNTDHVQSEITGHILKVMHSYHIFNH